MVQVGDQVVINGLQSKIQCGGDMGQRVGGEDEQLGIRLVDGSAIIAEEQNLAPVETNSGEDDFSMQKEKSEHRKSGSLTAGGLCKELAAAAFEDAKHHWILTLSYLLGILLASFATGFAVSAHDLKLYEALMDAVDYEGVLAAEEQVKVTWDTYYNSMGWIWCNDQCMRNKQKYDASLVAVEKAKQKVEDQICTAKHALGIFSTYGVAETREMFWKRFGQGKDFAKTQSFLDLVSTGFIKKSKKEDACDLIVRLIINILLNFTIGVIGAAVSFAWSLWGVIQSFQAGTLEGTLFFMLANLAAYSFLFTWLLGFYFAVAAGVIALTLLPSSKTIENKQTKQSIE